MSITIANKLPKDDQNGLAHLEARFNDDRDAVTVIVGLVRTDRVTELPHSEDNPRIVAVALLHVEALDGKEAAAVEKALRATYVKRTGKRELPFEGETE